MKKSLWLSILIVLTLPSLALAHPGNHAEISFWQSVLHPFTEFDHLLAIIAAAIGVSIIGLAKSRPVRLVAAVAVVAAVVLAIQ